MGIFGAADGAYHRSSSERKPNQNLVCQDRSLLSRKLFANVSSLFANGSEFALIGRHLARQLAAGKMAWSSRSGYSRKYPPLAGTAVRPGRLRRYGRPCARKVGKRRL